MEVLFVVCGLNIIAWVLLLVFWRNDREAQKARDRADTELMALLYLVALPNEKPESDSDEFWKAKQDLKNALINLCFKGEKWKQ